MSMLIAHLRLRTIVMRQVCSCEVIKIILKIQNAKVRVEKAHKIIDYSVYMLTS